MQIKHEISEKTKRREGKQYTKIIIVIDIREILSGHKSKVYSCTSELISDRMCLFG